MFHVLHRRLTPRHSPYALSSFHPRDAEKLIFHSCYAVGKEQWAKTLARPPGSLAAEPCPAGLCLHTPAAHGSIAKPSLTYDCCCFVV